MKICYLPLFIIAVVSLLVVIYLGLDSHSFSVDASSVKITAEILGQCGNSIIEYGEQCEGADFGGQTCESLGFSGGTLNCVSCLFDTSSCTEATVPLLPGGGAYVLSVVIFEGKASPQSTITLLKDAQIAAKTRADNNGDFQIILGGLSGGNYIFSVYSEDRAGIRSSLLVFLVNVPKKATTKVSGIFVAPTVEVDKEEVKKGEDLLIFGQSVPRADIRIFIKSEKKEFFVDTVTDNEGKYSHSFNTAPLDFEQYQITVIAFVKNLSSNLSKIIDFLVGTKTVLEKPLPKCPLIGDFDNDCLVDLVDFSILIYWFARPNPPAYIDLSEDGKIDLVDFSIMAHYWTG